jgi:hypothetical protein
MRRRTLGAAVLAAFLCSGLSTPAAGFSGGPPDGYAGDPPQFRDCMSCHSSFPPNSGSGNLGLQGLPAAYEPGQPYLLTVSLDDEGQQRWGFEMTVLDASLLQAGVMTPVDPQFVQVSEGPGTQRDYAKQTNAGTFPGSPSATWEISWEAPPAGTGPVHFFVAGNAANGNGSTSGDFVYLLDAVVPEASSGVAGDPAAQAGRELLVHPNPASGGQVSIRLRGEMEAPGPVAVFDASGRRIRELPWNAAGGGWRWDGRDAAGRRVAPGVYFLRVLETAGVRIVLLR